jgi:hypothetical protein
MSLYRARFSNSGRMKSWKQWHGPHGWKDAGAPVLGLDTKEWTIEDHALMFQAHHWSTLLRGLQTLGDGVKLAFPNDRVDIDHQYWVSKGRQHHQLNTMTRPSSRAFAEKRNHVHKVIVYKPNSLGQLGPKAIATKLLSYEVKSWIGCGQLAQALSAQGAKIGKAPSVAQDAIEEIIGVAAMVWDMVPR